MRTDWWLRLTTRRASADQQLVVPVPATVPPDLPAGSGDVEDMLFVIAQEQEAIRHADTKLGLLLTGESIVLGRVFPGRDVFLHPGAGLTGARQVIAVVAYYGAAVALVLSLAALVSGLVPRRVPPDPHETGSPAGGSASGLNRFAWPLVAGASFAQMSALTAHTLRAEAVQQALVLARIARTKFRLFDRSLWCALVCVALAVLWSLLRHS